MGINLTEVLLLFHSSFVYATGQCPSKYTIVLRFVYYGVNVKCHILDIFVSKLITFFRKDNLSIKLVLLFLYIIFAIVSLKQ